MEKVHKENKELYQCQECHFWYKEVKWAERCEAWCREKQSCNLEIIQHAITKEGGEL